MKRSKIFIGLIILSIILTQLAGCSGSTPAVNTEQNSASYVEGEDYQNFLNPVSAFAKAENGYYFLNNLKLYFFDTETKEAYIACSKPNCDHNSGECLAAFNIFRYYPFQLSYCNNSLYVLGWEEEGSNIRHNYIYEVSLDNFKRKKAAYLFDGTNTSSVSFIIHRGYVYYIKGSGSELKEQTDYIYRAKIGDTGTKRKEEKIYELSGIGASIWGLTASGNNLIVYNTSYGDTEGNDYKTSYSLIDIHSLESKELVGNGAYSLFTDGNYTYYGDGKNTINRIDLNTNEETFFCNIEGPCYISADSNYIYFDNQQSITIGKTDERDRKISVFDKNGKHITDIIPKNPEDECYFGGDDFMFFKETISGETIISDGNEISTKGYYAFDKSQLTSDNKQFIDME